MRLATKEKERYQGYAYAYPHKSAYRLLQPTVPLKHAWKNEDRSSLFLYVHIPFCEMRCGFCNLFTKSRPQQDMVAKYLDALQREMQVVAESIGDSRIARVAIGGGTPTFLDAPELERLFDHLENIFGVSPGSIPVSVETSPATATPDRLEVLKARGVERVSMGVESVHPQELKALGRPQKMDWFRKPSTRSVKSEFLC